MFIFVFGKIGFEPFRKFAPREHDAPPAAFTFEADICAKSCDDPLIRAAGMLFSEAQVIVETQVR